MRKEMPLFEKSGAKTFAPLRAYVALSRHTPMPEN
jgi:hypothetical protein